MLKVPLNNNINSNTCTHATKFTSYNIHTYILQWKDAEDAFHNLVKSITFVHLRAIICRIIMVMKWNQVFIQCPAIESNGIHLYVKIYTCTYIFLLKKTRELHGIRKTSDYIEIFCELHNWKHFLYSKHL